ncbi:hypothetical protein [Zoogloea sp.]|uniref:hypothetical protein n=1 Tax=Zoogloea sp. TaxID=49181 RepID=UPI003F66CA80
MLYFWYQGGVARGVYSGRFAFHALLNEQGKNKVDYEQYRAHVDEVLSGVASDDAARLGEVVAHEFLHHEVFMCSWLGRVVVGMRFVARVLFLFGFKGFLDDYYRVRTIYFLFSYNLHERVVGRMERCGGSVRKMDRKAILLLDAAAVAVMRTRSVYPCFGARLLYWCLGWLAQRDFSVVVAAHQRDGSVRHEQSSSKSVLGGVFNSAFTDNYGDGFFVKWVKSVFRFVSVEALASKFGRPLGADAVSEWARRKFLVEYDEICELVDKNLVRRQVLLMMRGGVDCYFDDYIFGIISFAFRLNGFDVRERFDEVLCFTEAYLECVRCGRFGDVSELERVMSGFFYYHGN